MQEAGVHISLRMAVNGRQAKISITKVRPVPRHWIAETYYALPEGWNGDDCGVVALTCWCPELGTHINWVHSFPNIFVRESRLRDENGGRKRFAMMAEFLDKFDYSG